jgi:hypothetical protein
MAHVMKGRLIQGLCFSFIFFWLLCQAFFALFSIGPWNDLEYSGIVYAVIFFSSSLFVWVLLRMHIRHVRSAEIEDNVVLMSLGLDS